MLQETVASSPETHWEFSLSIDIGLCLGQHHYRPCLFYRFHHLELLHCFHHYLGFGHLRCYKNYLDYHQRHIGNSVLTIEIGLCLGQHHYRPCLFYRFRHLDCCIVSIIILVLDTYVVTRVICIITRDTLGVLARRLRLAYALVSIITALAFFTVSTILSSCIVSIIILVLDTYVVTRIICITTRDTLGVLTR